MLRSDISGTRLWFAFGLTFAVGCGAAVLVGLGNPGNMGLCGACFLRDTGGALGLFAKGPKIFRPELAGLILGALAFTVASGKYGARSGSHAVTRFFFGTWMGIGALVFLGCPFRMLQRIGGGDLNAVVALIGFVIGVGAGVWFEKRGYNIGKTQVVNPAVGLLGPLTIVGVMALFLTTDLLQGPGPDSDAKPPHAPWLAALAIAAGAGAVMAATRFCAVTAARQVFKKEKKMMVGAAMLIAGYAIVSALGGRLDPSFDGQPAAHSDHLWSVLAMALVGLCGCLTGGCPVRQIVMTGEGNGDAFITVAGLIFGGALAHNLALASSGAGTTPAGRTAVVIGLALSVVYAFVISSRPREQA